MTPVRPSLTLVAVALALAGCGAKPKPIAYGQDECAECRMTLVDRHYGAELVTTRGKVFKFDDLGCLLRFLRHPEAGGNPRVFVVDFDRPGVFLPAADAHFLQHNRLRSPMGSGIAAFAGGGELAAAHRQLDGGGKTLRWPDLNTTP